VINFTYLKDMTRDPRILKMGHVSLTTPDRGRGQFDISRLTLEDFSSPAAEI